MSGNGCVQNAPVTISIDGTVVGHTVATSAGAYSALINPPDIGAGQLTVRVSCGPVFLSTIQVVATSKASNPEGGAAIFGVFVLLGLVLLRGQIGGSRRRRRTSGVRLDLEDL